MKIRIVEADKIVDVKNKKELQQIINEIFNDNTQLGLCFSQKLVLDNDGDYESEQVRGLDFKHSNFLTINYGKYDWLVLEKIA